MAREGGGGNIFFTFDSALSARVFSTFALDNTFTDVNFLGGGATFFKDLLEDFLTELTTMTLLFASSSSNMTAGLILNDILLFPPLLLLLSDFVDTFTVAALNEGLVGLGTILE